MVQITRKRKLLIPDFGILANLNPFSEIWHIMKTLFSGYKSVLIQRDSIRSTFNWWLEEIKVTIYNKV